MTRGARWYLVGSVVVVTCGALVALVGCSSQWIVEREPWRHEAEVACLNAGAVKEGPAKVRISAIKGPGMCGADFPMKVAALGENSAVGYSDEPPRPPGAIPNASMPSRWPVREAAPYDPPADRRPPPVYGQSLPPVQSQPAPYDPRYEQRYEPKYEPSYGAEPSARYEQTTEPYPRHEPPARYEPPPARRYEQPLGPPVSLIPPGVPAEDDDPAPGSRRPGYNAPRSYPQSAPLRDPPDAAPVVPLGPPRGPQVTGSIGPVEVKPAATLACPIVTALDRWIVDSVQPSALRWFGQPVVEIKQISAYSCRGMNGTPGARISEHAFGNALDIASFELANGRKVSVQHGWRGPPEEQGFLRDVQASACAQFTTVLAPGSNVYHYNHIHVDLMRRSSGRRICQPEPVSGDVVAARARGDRYAARPGEASEASVTGSIRKKYRRRSYGTAGATGENDGRLPLAIPGED